VERNIIDVFAMNRSLSICEELEDTDCMGTDGFAERRCIEHLANVAPVAMMMGVGAIGCVRFDDLEPCSGEHPIIVWVRAHRYLRAQLRHCEIITKWSEPFRM
jgi:hypothetical protein